MAFYNNAADYSSAFTSPNSLSGSGASLGSFLNYDRNQLVQGKGTLEFPNRDNLLLPGLGISDDIHKIGSVKERFLSLRELKKEKEKELETLKAKRKEIEDTISNLPVVLMNAQNQVMSYNLFDADELSENKKKELEIFNFYNDGLRRYFQKADVHIADTSQSVDKINDELAVLYDFISTAAKEIIPEENRTQNMCTVCIEKSINRACVPCGHTFCEGCITQIKTCPMCRQSIKETIKLFFTM